MPFIQPSANSFVLDEPQDLPLYHPGMLLVKIKAGTRLDDAGPAATGAAMLTRSAVSALPGLGTLLSFERSGLIRRVIPLTEPSAAVATGETPMLAAVATAVRTAARSDPNAGTSLVELYNDNDLPALESKLKEDPTIEDYSRVPVRYLQAKKRPARPRKSRTRAGAAPAATPPGSMIWNLNKIRWAAARARTGFRDATEINVAVLDTGIDEDHPDLSGLVASYSFDHPTTPSSSSRRDVHGHGTHVAGTIAARINNAVGINGICRCRIHAMKIFDDTPDYFASGGYFTYFVNPVMYRRSLSRCATLGVQVVNLSIGGRGAPDFQERTLFRTLVQRGVSVVAAMGNEGSFIASYPAAISGVIAVGATSIDDRKADFSNMGPHIALCAPGVSIWSTLPTYAGNQGFRAKPTFPPTPDLARPLSRDRNYAAWDGTSMASPHVAGAAALVLARFGQQSAAQMKDRLQSRAVKVAGMNGEDFTQEYGSGRLDLYKLLG